MTKNILAVAIIAVSILAYNLWLILDCFYICIALTFVLCASLIVMLAEKSSYLKRLGLIFLFISINNLLDELFFDPKAFGINEYVVSAVIIVHQMYMQYNHARTTNR